MLQRPDLCRNRWVITLRSHPRSRRFNPVEPAVERWVYMPVYIDNKAYDLMPEADEDYRPRR